MQVLIYHYGVLDSSPKASGRKPYPDGHSSTRTALAVVGGVILGLFGIVVVAVYCYFKT